LFLTVDLAFFGANIIKIEQGGWFPLGIAATVFAVMTTWKKGRTLLGDRIRASIVPLSDFFELMHIELPARVPGTAVFMTSNAEGTPPALLHNFQHNRVVHEQVILLTILTEEVAYVQDDERAEVEELREGFVRVVARYGFMEDPNIVELLARDDTPTPPIQHTTFFLGRETLLAQGRSMVRWRERLFGFMTRNALPATAFFNVPPERVVELGSQVEL
jgi:KUP system potassium uptake protein